MRVARRCVVRPEGGQFFHVMSRIVEKRHIFGIKEKDVFLGIMKQLESFSGVEILTYCIMGNHFHIIVYIPEKEGFYPMESSEVFRRIAYIYPDKYVRSEKLKYESLLDRGQEDQADCLLQRYIKRMCCLTSFIKDLKQRFTQRYNLLNHRKGNLWEERFKSVLIDNEVDTLKRFVRYVDLNPLRAGIVDNPNQYKWSGIGEYFRGVKKSMLNFKESIYRLQGIRVKMKNFVADYLTCLQIANDGGKPTFDSILCHPNKKLLQIGISQKEIKHYHHTYLNSIMVGRFEFLKSFSSKFLLSAGLGFFNNRSHHLEYNVSKQMNSQNVLLKLRRFKNS